MKIPEGWKLVPEKETHEMRGAFREADPVKTVRCLIDWHVANERSSELEGK